MKCPDRCPGEPVNMPLVERGTGEREKRKFLSANCRRSKRCWSLCTGLRSFMFWRSHAVPFAFQVCSLQGLVKLETELARRTGCRAQVKQLKSEKLSPCSSGNLKDSNACASTTLPWPLPTSKVWFLEMPKTDSVLILLPEINDFLQNRQWGSRSISLCFQMEQNTAHFPLIFPGVTHARNWLTDNDLTDRWSAG